MKISKKTWQGFVERLRKIDDRAAEKVVSYMLDHDWSTGQGRKELLDYAFAVATKYGEGAAEMACQMYDAVSEASPKRVPPAEPAKTATYGEVARAVNGSLLFSPTPESAGAAIGRMVKTAGVDTTIQNAIRDGAEWAWIPSGDSCTFCMVLASQGWVKASKNVLKGGHASHIHNNCDCTFAVRHDGVSTVEGYDPDGLRAWWDAAEGTNSKEKLNYLRRKNYAENRDVINAQKREAYANRIMARRKIGEQGQEIIDKPTYNKLTRDFLRHGGLIIRGEEAARHLKSQDAYAAYLPSFYTAYIRDDATVSDVLEEMYHAEQDRKKVYGEVLTEEVRLRREIDAQNYLISVEKKYKIPLEEREVTRKNLERYKSDLRKLLNTKE